MPMTSDQLPSKSYNNLIGRNDVLEEITAALGDPSGTWIVVIDGIGGVGKTALAREIAERCLSDTLFDSVVWTQIPKENLDLTEHEKGISKTLTYVSILDSIARQMGATEVYFSLLENGKEGFVRDLLKKKKVLIVLDGLDTASGIVSRLQLLLNPSKALLTSRIRTQGNVFSVHLAELGQDYAIRLIREAAQERGVQRLLNASETDLKQIARSAGGSPLALKIIVGQLSHLPLDTVIHRLQTVPPPKGENDKSDYVIFYKDVFFSSWQMLSENGKNLLIAMANFVPNVGGTYEAIKATSDLADDVLARCIDELWKHSFLEKGLSPSSKKVRYYLHPFTQYFVLSDVVNEWTKTYITSKPRYIEAMLTFAQAHQTDFSVLETESNNIFGAMAMCRDLSDFDTLAKYINVLSFYLVESPHWEIFRKFAPLLLESNLPHNMLESILANMAKVEELNGDYNKARQLYKQLLQHTKDDSLVYRILGESARLAILQRDYIDAKRDLEGKLEIAERRRNKREEVDILFELVKLYRNMGDLDGGYSLWNRCIEIARMISYQTGVAKLLLWKSSALYQTKKLDDAAEYCKEALKIASMIGDHSLADEAKAHLEVLNSMLGKRVFISYSHRDRSFVERLAKELKMTGIPVWWDEMEIKVGHSIIKKVSEGISGATYLAVVLSPSSIESDFVQRELEIALMGQLSTKKITVLPLLLTDCEIPTFLKVIKWADFRTDYQTGFIGLLDTLAES